MDRAELADFLRRRREALRPSDVGLGDGARRRTPGLRREEVAMLAGMSVDYVSRLEQQRATQPSEQMIVAMTRALRLTLDERDHLFRLAGHNPPARLGSSGLVDPAILRILDRLHDTPAEVIDDLGNTLVQNAAAQALMGDDFRFDGLDRSLVHRWFTHPRGRDIYPERDHDHQSRIQVADVRLTVGRRGAQDPRVRAIVDSLLSQSAEFRSLWEQHDVAARHADQKTLVHPELGEIEVYCQILTPNDESQRLLVFTAEPGSESAAKLDLLAVVGRQEFAR
ncbi:XRE family transcriptional regulator [Frondihabitans sp. PAMC 28766]|uniref:helix-turn-helix transcriptional regulator n=1 Tax=Frondihabitans sp. PAMC 28766 TaxID=1795630 RepID=UPI00078D4E98|nr:helix-turn-helix transcriptional regulator [Frondihabitans sp. PAMC 28766]AMM22238.1 XRE family transcriptional regulator [Frondihabitans sp. PAMC 28766]